MEVANDFALRYEPQGFEINQVFKPFLEQKNSDEICKKIEFFFIAWGLGLVESNTRMWWFQQTVKLVFMQIRIKFVLVQTVRL